MPMKDYLQTFMAQQNGLSATPLLEEGLIAATGPGNTWALTELGHDMLMGEYSTSVVARVSMEQDLLNAQIRNALDEQIGGRHYKDFPIQPAEFIEKNKIPFLDGCVIKRMCRHGNKNGAEDLRKAIHEIRLILQLRYGLSE